MSESPVFTYDDGTSHRGIDLDRFANRSATSSDAAGIDSPRVLNGRLAGHPPSSSEPWFEQAVNGFCVPAGIAKIVSEYTGCFNQDEGRFVSRANELGVFDVGPDGVPGIGVEGALTLLEDAGVAASLEFAEGIETLADYLDDGRHVMLAMDRAATGFGEGSPAVGASEVIVVKGMDPNRGVVTVSDPGDPEGQVEEYPVAGFQQAWDDAGLVAIVCDVVPDRVAAHAYVTPAEVPASGLQVRDRSRLKTTVSWTVGKPWAVLPIVLSARPAAARSR